MNNKYFEQVEWVIFDLDNTLYPYGPAHQAAIEKLEDFLIRYLPINNFHVLYNQAREIVKARLGHCSSAHSRLLYIKVMFSLCKENVDPKVILDAEKTYWDAYLENTKLFEGIIDMLKMLQERGIKKYLLTDLTTQIQLNKIKYLGLAKYFEQIITSEEAGGDKITRKPFQLLIELEKIDLNSKGCSIGDSICDIEVPKAIFKNCLTFQRDDHPRFEKTDILFDNFTTFIE